MISKRSIFILGIFLILVSVLSVCASDNQQNIYEIQQILDETNASDLTGCCSVALQLDGNNSMFSFRRDANLTADIYIEEIDWHGIPAIKQYKTEGDYFCQVIITSNGWTIGYGGIDDGPDNEKIEEITSQMITDDNSISEDGLVQIQQIKEPYKLGHLLIKAPNGNYGVAFSDNHFKGKLEPGQYIVIPNREKYMDNGSLSLNTSDKVAAMIELAQSDAFGLTRRDITTYHFHTFENNTAKVNVTDAYLSNDDGSKWGMSTGGLVDNVYFNKTLFKAEDIPIAPNYQYMGNMTLHESIHHVSKLMLAAILVGIVIFVAILFFVVYQSIKYIRYRRHRR